MNTKGEIESKIEKGMNEIFVYVFGKGPSSCRVSLVQKHALLIIQNIFSTCEMRLLETDPGKKVYKEMRTALLDGNCDKMKCMVGIASGVTALHMHHDISTCTGEEAFLFSLSDVPEYIIAKKRLFERKF